MKLKILIVLSLIVSSTIAFGGEQYGNKSCDDKPFSKSKTTTFPEMKYPIFKRYCYNDRNGNYILYLTEKKDKPYKDEVLSTVIQAHLLKLDTEKNAFVSIWSIKDYSEPREAGVNFRSKLLEIVDIDQDGVYEPIIVYRFFMKNDSNFDTDEFSGRLKIIMYYRGKKISIRALTGQFDEERRTTANGEYFSLPESIQQYLINKIASMYRNNNFGFDNSNSFVPRRDKND